MLRKTLLKRLVLLTAGIIVPRVVRSESYLTVDQARAAIFPGSGFTKVGVTLTADQKKAIEKASKERVRQTELNVWKSSEGNWFIVDEVLGKHEFITYAVGISAAGAVRGIEVLTYRETYGHEIKLPKWRAQFHNKTSSAALKIDEDIKNISGATLSCVHLTDGVRRLLQTHHLVLRSL